MEHFLLSADVGRILGLSAAGVRAAAAVGRLLVAAVTPGGVRLFRACDVELLRKEREATKRPRRPVVNG